MFDSGSLLEAMRAEEALLEGHFLLSSGLHSDRYFQCARFLQHPQLAGKAAETLARTLSKLEPELVVGPAMGAVTFSYEVGRALGLRAFWTEREDGLMTVRRGFQVKPGERIVVVEDVLTTGGSAREVVRVLEELGGKVVAAACLVNRSGGNPFDDLNIPLVALADVQARSWRADECPMCAAGETAVKPGSRPGLTQSGS